jgi:hypothetical protein
MNQPSLFLPTGSGSRGNRLSMAGYAAGLCAMLLTSGLGVGWPLRRFAWRRHPEGLSPERPGTYQRYPPGQRQIRRNPDSAAITRSARARRFRDSRQDAGAPRQQWVCYTPDPSQARDDNLPKQVGLPIESGLIYYSCVRSNLRGARKP